MEASFYGRATQAMEGSTCKPLSLSQPMNQGLGNAPYSKKKKVYLEDSILKAAREFVHERMRLG
jgi:hypothetical protein